MIHVKLTGQRIKQLCKEKGITVKQIQEELGIGAYQSVYNWFCGKTLPSLDNFYSLCKLLGVSMESLIVEAEHWIICEAFIDIYFQRKMAQRRIFCYKNFIKRIYLQ